MTWIYKLVLLNFQHRHQHHKSMSMILKLFEQDKYKCPITEKQAVDIQVRLSLLEQRMCDLKKWVVLVLVAAAGANTENLTNVIKFLIGN